MIKIGIAGAGSIVPRFLAAQALIPEMKVTAICSSGRSRQRMEEFSRDYGIDTICSSYDEMLETADINTVYVAVPNHLHFSFAKKALEKGLSVICEKPFCASAAELRELIELAGEKKVFLFEAISNLYFPNYRKVQELLPQLGAVRIVEMNYSQYSSRYDAFLAGEILPVFDPAKQGGALMDLNVYNIHFAVGLFGRPQTATYYPNMQRGVDTSGVLILTYPGFTCSLIAAKDCKAPCRISIQGEKGCISSESPSNSFEAFAHLTNTGDLTKYRLNEEPERLYYELRAYAEMARDQNLSLCEMRLEQSLIVQEILEQAYKGV